MSSPGGDHRLIVDFYDYRFGGESIVKYFTTKIKVILRHTLFCDFI